MCSVLIKRSSRRLCYSIRYLSSASTDCRTRPPLDKLPVVLGRVLGLVWRQGEVVAYAGVRRTKETNLQQSIEWEPPFLMGIQYCSRVHVLISYKATIHLWHYQITVPSTGCSLGNLGRQKHVRGWVMQSCDNLHTMWVPAWAAPWCEAPLCLFLASNESP